MKNLFFVILFLISFSVQSLYGRDPVTLNSYTIQVGEFVDISLSNDLLYIVSDASIVEKDTNKNRWKGIKAGTTTIKYYGVNWSGNYTVWHGDKIDEFYCNYIITINVVDVKNVSIPLNITLSLGEKFNYTPIITDKLANANLTWTSSNPSVATVDENGGVDTQNVGWACITCKAANGVFAQSFVTVSPIMTQKVTLDKNKYEMNIGDNIQLTYTVTPENATIKDVIWLSSNDNVAQVDDSGNVVAVGYGYCCIFAKMDDGSGKFGKCLIHVQGNDIKGDIDGDGKVSMTDVVSVIDIVLNRK